MRKTLFVYLVVVILAFAACTQDTAPGPAPAGPKTLTVMTHDSFEISEDVLAAFESQHNARVQFLKAGDTGTALNKAILAKNNPLADVFYGVDNTFLSRALAEDIFAAYATPALAEIPAEFQLDPENRALPVDYGDVCLNYELRYFEENALSAPSIPGRPAGPGLPGAARGREPGYLVTRAGVPPGHSRPFWPGRLPGLLAGAAGQ